MVAMAIVNDRTTKWLVCYKEHAVSYACLNFKVGSECLLQGIRLAIGLQYELPTL